LYRNGHVETVRPLFDHGAEVNTAAREYGRSLEAMYKEDGGSAGGEEYRAAPRCKLRPTMAT
jgi:hypothetical protein